MFHPIRGLFVGVALFVLSPLALAQESPEPARMLAAMRFQTPIFADSRGIWTLGDRFEASFHDGFSFVTRSADRRTAWPLRWKTVSITAGGAPVTTDLELRIEHEETRCRHVHGAGIVETYDVRAAGVEQSFLIRQRPVRGGDLVVTGRVTTELRADPVVDRHTEIVFRDASGAEITSYGKAFAVDARGRSVDVTASYDGARIALRVPGSWLAEAAFPILVDPLVGARTIRSFTPGDHPVAEMSIATETVSRGHNTLVAYVERVRTGTGPTDYETRGFVVLCNSDFTEPSVVFGASPGGKGVEITSECLAPVHGARRWVVTMRGIHSGPEEDKLYVHDFGNTRFRSGTIHTIPVPRTNQVLRPIVGGGAQAPASGIAGTRALIAFELVWLDPLAFTPAAIVFDAKTKRFVTGVLLLDSKVTDYRIGRSMSVNQLNNGAGNSPWMVVWNRAEGVFGEHRIRGTLVEPDGSFAAPADFGPGLSGKDSFVRRNRVAGRAGRYMLAYEWQEATVANGWGAEHLRVQRFDWPLNAPAPAIQPSQDIGVHPATMRHLMDLAFDGNSRSHWAVTFSDATHAKSSMEQHRTVGRILRLSIHGTIQEQKVLWNVTGSNSFFAGSAVCFDPVTRCFPVVFNRPPSTTSIGPWVVRGTRFCYPQFATAFGKGIGSISATLQTPTAATKMTVQLSGVPPLQNATLLMGTERVAIELSKSGLPGHVLYVGGTVTEFETTTTSQGTAKVRIPLPADVRDTTFYFQWRLTDPKKGGSGLLSPGLEARVW